MSARERKCQGRQASRFCSKHTQASHRVSRLKVGAIVTIRSGMLDLANLKGKGGAIYSSDVSIDRACVAALGRGANAHAKGPLRRRALVWLLASAMVALGTADASSTPGHKHVPPHQSKAAKAEHHKHGSAPEAKHSERAVGPRIPLPSDQPTADNLAPAPQLSRDLAATKQAIELVRQRKFSDATTLAASISDPVAQKLVEWALLRNSDSTAGFDRYASFIQANADWPSIPLLRRRAEARLWQERRDAATVRRFFGEQPVSALGRLALARVQLREGDRAGAERQIRAVWQSAEMSAELEATVTQDFHDELGPADHAARMDRRIGAKDFGAAMRAAKRLGTAQIFDRQGLRGRRGELHQKRRAARSSSQRSTCGFGLSAVPSSLAAGAQ